MKYARDILILGLLSAGLLAAGQPNASPAAGDAVAGKDAFATYCSICHGAAARGFIGPSIAGVNWTTSGLHAIVRGGLGGYGGMPAFNADAVTDKNIADIAAYLLSLAPAAPATPSASPSPASGATTASATVVTTPAVSATTPSGDVSHGRGVYAANCGACHGASGQGGIGPSLRGEKARKDTAAAIAWIKNPKAPMPKLYPVALSEKDVEDVAAFVESL